MNDSDFHKKLLLELPSLGDWYHDIDFGKNVKLNLQKNARSSESMWKKWIKPHLPSDISGKTVLDLGCNSGYLGMKMKKLGAKKVVGIDKSEQYIRQAEFVSKWFDVEIELKKEDVYKYCLTSDERFDYVICFGLFYHLRYGLVVLDRLSEMTKSKLFFQSEVVGPKVSKISKQDFSPNDGNYMLTDPQVPKMVFIEQNYASSPYNWWIPNDPALICMLRSAKMRILAHPEKGVFVCNPRKQFQKQYFEKCVFPYFKFE